MLSESCPNRLHYRWSEEGDAHGGLSFQQYSNQTVKLSCAVTHYYHFRTGCVLQFSCSEETLLLLFENPLWLCNKHSNVTNRRTDESSSRPRGCSRQQLAKTSAAPEFNLCHTDVWSLPSILLLIGTLGWRSATLKACRSCWPVSH